MFTARSPMLLLSKMISLTTAATGSRLGLRPELIKELKAYKSFGNLCDPCAQAKGVKHSLRKRSPTKYTKPGEGVAIDFFAGPCLSRHHNKHTLLFVDLATGYIRLRHVHSRAEASDHI